MAAITHAADQVRHDGLLVYHGDVEVVAAVRPIAVLRVRASSPLAVLRARAAGPVAALRIRSVPDVVVTRTRE